MESSNPQETKKTQSKQIFRTQGFAIHLNQYACMRFSLLFGYNECELETNTNKLGLFLPFCSFDGPSLHTKWTIHDVMPTRLEFNFAINCKMTYDIRRSFVMHPLNPSYIYDPCIIFYLDSKTCSNTNLSALLQTFLIDELLVAPTLNKTYTNISNGDGQIQAYEH